MEPKLNDFEEDVILENEENEYADEFAREFAETTYNEQEELKFLDDLLFGGH